MRALIPALFALALAGCSCQRQADADAGAAATTPAAPVEDAAARERAQSSAKAEARALENLKAMSDAVGELHKYLQALSSGRREEADRYWAAQRLPRGNEEADLRRIEAFASMRIENQAPKPLDDHPVAEALEIPVELRVGLADGENRRYRGWYRMRRNPVDRRWELTGASIAAELR